MKLLKVVLMVWVGAFLLNLMLFSFGYAQEVPVPTDPWWKAMLTMAMTSVLPALWAPVGPLVTAWVTKQVNKVSVYIPRSVQVVMSAIVTAALAGLTGDMTVAAQAGAAGAAGQILAATPPEALRTTAP